MKYRSAFTLLETIVSIALSVAVMSVVFSLWYGGRHREQVIHISTAVQGSRIFTDYLRSDIRAVEASSGHVAITTRTDGLDVCVSKPAGGSRITSSVCSYRYVMAGNVKEVVRNSKKLRTVALSSVNQTVIETGGQRWLRIMAVFCDGSVRNDEARLKRSYEKTIIVPVTVFPAGEASESWFDYTKEPPQ